METICASCIHDKICKYKNDMDKLINKSNGISDGQFDILIECKNYDVKHQNS